MYKIYKIIDNTNGNVYIGQTIQQLDKRLNQHRTRMSCTSRDIIKNGDYRIELIEETDDKTRERYWIDNTECVNKVMPGRSHKDWREENKDKIKQAKREYDKIYREKHKDKIKAYRDRNKLLKV